MLKRVIGKTSATDVMPIEVSDIKDAIIECGFQDDIIIVPEETDPKELLGVYYQYTTHPKVYATPILTSLIIYSSKVCIEWQRLICCKEMMHICERGFEQTKTQKDVSALLERLLKPLSTEEYGIVDLMAGNDKLALYKALGVLFPVPAREQAIEALGNGSKTESDIAKWVCLPVSLVQLVLLPQWPELFERLSGT